MSSRVAAALSQAPFKVGHKQVYLPDFSITLHRQSHLGPKYATFTVPLWFSKLDLRDYLFHAYDVRILTVRSYIKLGKVTRGQPSYLKEDFEAPNRRFYRPQSTKRMTVELEVPFQWPEAPEDLAPWQEDYSTAMRKESEKSNEARGPLKDTLVDKEHVKVMREHAAALLEGREKWRPNTTETSGPVLSRD